MSRRNDDYEKLARDAGFLLLLSILSLGFLTYVVVSLVAEGP